MTPQDISWFIDNDLQRELLAVPGVSQVQRMGGVDREIRVELDPARLLAYGVSADHGEQPAARASTPTCPAARRRSAARRNRSARSAAPRQCSELADIAHHWPPTAARVRLGDLGTVTDSASDLQSISRYNGQPVVGFMVLRTRGASEVQVFDRMDEAPARDRGARIRTSHFTEIGSTVEFIRGMHESSIHAL